MRADADLSVRHGTVDVDSFPIEVHGEQPGGAYNGYYKETVYHPLLASFSVEGDYDSGFHGYRLGNGFLHAVLRRGTAHTAEGALRFMQEVVRKCSELAYVLDFRLDAGFTHGLVMDDLTEHKQRFIGRLKNNPVLDRLAEPYLTRPVGRPPKEGYEDVFELGLHQAESWKHPQRLLLVVVDQPDPVTGQLNLLPHYFFLVTNRSVEEIGGEAALAHYRNRGTFEDRLGEFNATVGPRLSSPRVRGERSHVVVGAVGLQPGVAVAWRVGRWHRRLLGLGTFSTVGAQGRRSGSQEFATIAGRFGGGSRAAVGVGAESPATLGVAGAMAAIAVPLAGFGFPRRPTHLCARCCGYESIPSREPTHHHAAIAAWGKGGLAPQNVPFVHFSCSPAPSYPKC